MTKTFSINENNDIYIGRDGNLAIASGINAVLFACQNAAQAQRGEMLFATDEGMPNFQTIWNGNPNLAQFEAALRATLLNVSGVVEIKELDTAINNNVLYYKVVILTQFGEGVLNGDL